jgi:hypothetical protein
MHSADGGIEFRSFVNTMVQLIRAAMPNEADRLVREALRRNEAGFDVHLHDTLCDPLVRQIPVGFRCVIALHDRRQLLLPAVLTHRRMLPACLTIVLPSGRVEGEWKLTVGMASKHELTCERTSPLVYATLQRSELRV